MPNTATSLASWVKAIKVTLDERGIESATLFKQAGLDVSMLNDPNARYPLEGTTQLWALAVAATDDESLGLSVSRNINQTTFHALGFSLMASPTLAATFERLVRYFRIVTNAGELSFAAEGAHFKLVLNPVVGPTPPAVEATDGMVAVIFRLCRMLTAKQFQAIKITLERQEPQNRALFDKVFQAPIEFGASETSIHIAADVLNKPLANGNAELAQHNEQILQRYLSELDTQHTAKQVYDCLVEQLPQGEPSQERIAESLHMSLRKLQRKLRAEETSYTEILNQTRRGLALSYLDENRYSISEIAYLLGFADTSSFTRAFKRWVGKSPTKFQQSK